MEKNSGTATKNQTTTERKSDRELVVTRTFNGPQQMVFDAWTKPELMKRWWVPKSFPMKFESCEMDARTGGKYRFVFSAPNFPQPVAFFGKYLEVIPGKKIVWTNEESGDQGSVTTVTFEEKAGQTVVVLSDVYPTKEALDEAIASGSTSGYPEQFNQLDEMLVSQPA